MTVRDLISELQRFDPHLEVVGEVAEMGPVVSEVYRYQESAGIAGKMEFETSEPKSINDGIRRVAITLDLA